MGIYKADSRHTLSKNSGKGWAHKIAKRDHEAPIASERRPQAHIEIPESLGTDMILEPTGFDWDDPWIEEEFVTGKYKRW